MKHRNFFFLAPLATPLLLPLLGGATAGALFSKNKNKNKNQETTEETEGTYIQTETYSLADKYGTGSSSNIGTSVVPKDNTKIFIGIGVGILLITIIVFFVIKKK